jgi:hypothetical protein
MRDDFLQKLVRHVARLPFVVGSSLIEQLIQRGTVNCVGHPDLVILMAEMKNPAEAGF